MLDTMYHTSLHPSSTLTTRTSISRALRSMIPSSAMVRTSSRRFLCHTSITGQTCSTSMTASSSRFTTGTSNVATKTTTTSTCSFLHHKEASCASDPYASPNYTCDIFDDIFSAILEVNPCFNVSLVHWLHDLGEC